VLGSIFVLVAARHPYKAYAQSRLNTALFRFARDCDSAADFIFTFGVGSGPGPSGFRPRRFRPPRPRTSDDIYNKFRNQNVSLLLEIISLYDSSFHFTSLFTTLFTTYYIYYVLYIYS
jgi:hypothetical protein